MSRPRTALVLVLATLAALAEARAAGRVGVRAGRTGLSADEPAIRASAIHDSIFAVLPRSAMHLPCEGNAEPQALTTPDPLLAASSSRSRVAVSFVIGIDGRIHSPLILESEDPAEESIVLETVRYWRYRPALCNGVPAEAEAKVEFSSR